MSLKNLKVLESRSVFRLIEGLSGLSFQGSGRFPRAPHLAFDPQCAKDARRGVQEPSSGISFSVPCASEPGSAQETGAKASSEEGEIAPSWKIYSPHRILHPMERSGPKGSRRWRRITWERAWERITAKASEALATWGVNSVVPIPLSGELLKEQVFQAPQDGEKKETGRGPEGASVPAYRIIEWEDLGAGFHWGKEEQEEKFDCLFFWDSGSFASDFHGLRQISEARDKDCRVLAVNSDALFIKSESPDEAVSHLSGKEFLLRYIREEIKKKPGAALFLKEENDQEFLWRQIEPFNQIENDESDKEKSKAFSLCVSRWQASKRCLHVVGRNGAEMVRLLRMAERLRIFGLPPPLKQDAGILGEDIPLSGLSRRSGAGREGDSKGRIPPFLHYPSSEKPGTRHGLAFARLAVLFNRNPGSDPLVNQKILFELKREELFAVGMDMFMTEPMEYCDIILPIAHELEKTGARQKGSRILPGETATNSEFFEEFLRRMRMKTRRPLHASFTSLMGREGRSDGAETKVRSFPQNPERDWFNSIAPRAEGSNLSRQNLLQTGLISGKPRKPIAWNSLFPPELAVKKTGSRPEENRVKAAEEAAKKACSLVRVSGHSVTMESSQCDINPEDAWRLGIGMGDKVRLTYPGGEAVLFARLTERVRPGVLKVESSRLTDLNLNPENEKFSYLTAFRVLEKSGCMVSSSMRLRLRKDSGGMKKSEV